MFTTTFNRKDILNMTTTLEVKEDVHSSTLSVRSGSTLCTISETSFQPSHNLTVNARGIGAFRLPIPSRQTETFIYHPDGTEAYVSTRDKISSGNAVLSNKLGSLIRTEYFFGPNRDPILHLLQVSSGCSDVTVSSNWKSRTMQFVMPGGRKFEWEYAKERRADGQKVRLIVFRAVETGKTKEKKERIAQLVRGVDTRTPGTSKCTAGNGGELQIDELALKSHKLDESVVVATCLMMLKKEMDRRRMLQFAMIAGAAGS
jgi:hypothetical protein